MTRRDDHIQDDHFQSAHSEKEEWVTPKISPLGAVETHGKVQYNFEGTSNYTIKISFGPS